MSPPTKTVSVWHVRRLFNNGKFWQKTQSGELVADVKTSRLAKPEMNQLPGTLSQMVEYKDANGDRVALVHQYLQPNQKIGGHGYPDPKLILVDGIIYIPKNPPESGLPRMLFIVWEWLQGIKYKLLG